MTTKYELDYLINNIISNSEKIAKLKLTDDNTSPSSPSNNLVTNLLFSFNFFL